MHSSTLPVGLILLAAGASTRMGSPKQLLPYQGRSLLRYMAEVALASDCDPIVVVLGAHSDRTRQAIVNLPLHTVENNQWAEGIGSSIRVGVKQITRINQQLDAVVVMLCDQPLVTASKLNQLLKAYQINQSQIIASAYADTLGVPALFSHVLFPDLLYLTANVGAKHLIQQYGDQAYAVPFPEGAIDLDTPEDYQQMRCGIVS